MDVCVNKEMTRPAAVRSVFLLLGPPQAETAAGVAKALTNGLPLSLLIVIIIESDGKQESMAKKETDCGGDGNWRSAVKCFVCGSAIWLTTSQPSKQASASLAPSLLHDLRSCNVCKLRRRRQNGA